MNYLGHPYTAVAKAGVGELVFMRDIPHGTTVLECLHAAWGEAQTEARLAYEHWRARGGKDPYLVYQAAAERADRAQDVLAEWAARDARVSQRRARLRKKDQRVAAL
jgi:hypothetical protein